MSVINKINLQIYWKKTWFCRQHLQSNEIKTTLVSFITWQWIQPDVLYSSWRPRVIWYVIATLFFNLGSKNVKLSVVTNRLPNKMRPWIFFSHNFSSVVRLTDVPSLDIMSIFCGLVAFSQRGFLCLPLINMSCQPWHRFWLRQLL